MFFMLCISYEEMERTGAGNSETHFYSDADNNVILSRADIIGGVARYESIN